MENIEYIELKGTDDLGDYHYYGKVELSKEGQEERHGYGVCKWTNGHEYDGHWKKNLMHGEGVFIEANGT